MPWFLEKKEDAKASMADYGDAAGWEKQQMKTFTAWVNMYLQRSKDVAPVVNIVTDFSEGIRLIKLLDNILEVRSEGACSRSPCASELLLRARGVSDVCWCVRCRR